MQGGIGSTGCRGSPHTLTEISDINLGLPFPWAIGLKVIEGRPRDVLITNTHNSMSGPVRQPINVLSLSTYIEKNVPVIKLPIGLKQVLPRELPGGGALTDICFSLALVNRILLTSSAQPMAGNMYYERSRRASYSPRPHIRLNVNSASSTP